MRAGIDASYGAAMFIGYHSGAGSNGSPLAHTMNTENTRILVNGLEASEFMLNAYTAASFGVPVVLVSGDQQLCEHVKALNPNIGTVAVHEGLGGATTSLHPAVAAARIGEAALAALKGDVAACRLQLPGRFDVTVDFKEHVKAYRGSFYPGASQSGPRSMSYSCTEWFDVMRMFSFVL